MLPIVALGQMLLS